MSSFDRIITSVSMNATAARVTGKGEHWEPRKAQLLTDGEVFSENVLPCLPMPPETPISAGQRFGRLVVKGYAGKGPNGAKYVVRCDCGNWCHRKMKGLRTPRNQMCPVCNYAEEVKAGTHPGKAAWLPT